ncbi:MAG TPA: hypothetical protein VM753_13915, partial [Anaeromyxobacter sp.]|nr:hypothetical protein [Anaeromyxobacter sp.]
MTAPHETPARPSFADAREIDAFVETLGRFERREIDADQWRAYRVARGAYGQRQEGVHMLRVKVPQGVLDAAQLRAIADAAARWSRGYGHVTTRQNVQLHFLRPADLEPAMRRLAEAGVTTSGAGGNAVRNVVACPLAGVSADELFDPTPYAEAMTRHFLRHPLGDALPRKFKIAFEGCAHDHVATPIQDLGFRARVRDEDGVPRRGFAVTVAGGTSSLCTSGSALVDFLPAGDVLALAEAVVRVFHARGDRLNKQRNRLKFLVRELGFDAFRALVEAELARVRASGAPRLPFDPERPPEEVFDPTPYAEAVTRHFLRHPLGDALPRKFKIAFEGCLEDHALTAIHDIGLRALTRLDENGKVERGFRIAAGGGTSTMARSAGLLHDFLPVGDMLASAEAIVRVFHKLGDYQHKARNRMKFLIKSLGWEGFQAQYEQELAGVFAAGAPSLPFDAENPPIEQAPDWTRPAPPSTDAVAERVAAQGTSGPGIHP